MICNNHLSSNKQKLYGILQHIHSRNVILSDLLDYLCSYSMYFIITGFQIINLSNYLSHYMIAKKFTHCSLFTSGHYNVTWLSKQAILLGVLDVIGGFSSYNPWFLCHCYRVKSTNFQNNIDLRFVANINYQIHTQYTCILHLL